MVKIDNINIEYYVDYLKRQMHLLDLENFANQSVRNCIDQTWQRKLIYQEMLLTDVMDFDWYIYALDGVVLVYRHYNLSFVDDYSQLHQAFTEKLKNHVNKPH